MDLSKRIGWLDGEWGSVDELTLPIQDRGLNLADGIFETILILKGQPKLLNAHINRWHRSASQLGMASPPKTKFIKNLIEEAINRHVLINRNGVVRINWSRGNCCNRGINIPAGQADFNAHRFWLEIKTLEPSFQPFSVMISRHEKRNAHSRLSRFKTFAYGQAIQARNEAKIAGFDDALLLSTNGELCCGSTSNLLIKRKDQWLTPPLSSGCLPGIMRQQGINCGLFEEQALSEKIKKEDQCLLINSLSCHPISKLNNQSLQVYSDPREFWYSLMFPDMGIVT